MVTLSSKPGKQEAGLRGVALGVALGDAFDYFGVLGGLETF
jgi:hypothetical protein